MEKEIKELRSIRQQNTFEMSEKNSYINELKKQIEKLEAEVRNRDSRLARI
jgi:peptidoglycan hydrolase CwlO-like protein